ncbi:hypothetical protein [Xanthomonas phage X1]|nr:hypothetical protein [Xanthomonas phage X1]
MSDIKLVWTTHGQILGEVTAKGDGYEVENPVFISPGGQGVSMLPVNMFSDETKITLTKEDLRFGGHLFEPITELRNAYTQQFGSGIQLLS